MIEYGLIKKRVEVFLKDNISAHIILKSGKWLNGYIIKTYDDYFEFLDRIEPKPIPVFYAS